MCLPDFIECKQINEKDAIVGYRNWRERIKDSDKLELLSQYINYIWKPLEGPHEVKMIDSGIYAYNNYYNYYNNSNYNYNNNYNYNYTGIISQWGKTAIHKIGQRSEYARVITLFTIRELDTSGPQEFLDWLKKFNEHIENLAEKYQANTMHYQDFVDPK